ncbi:MAG: hypothetical protein HKM28_03875, partial [Flavobacteriaceae bacterium]|nr:hypothetical protein [Flavobacteriaceae bacterium]
MKRIFNKALLLCSLLVMISTQAMAAGEKPPQKNDFKKEIKKSFKMNADGTVDLSNKYGNINLNTWNKNEVNIAVTITVKARNESSADNIFKRINIDFSDSASRVSATTDIESQKSSWWNDGDKGDFRIDYEVSIPSAASLELSNKYGNSFIDEIGGSADVSVKYGDLDLRGVEKSSKIYLGYGNANIGDLRNLEANVNYSKFKVGKTEQVDVESKYSKVYIDEARNIKSRSKYDSYDLGEIVQLDNEGKYDHFEIRSANRVQSTAKYSNFEIDELSEEGLFELSYGGVIIEELQAGFELVSVEGAHAHAKIYTDDNVAFRLEAECEYGSISYPSGMRVSYDSQKNHRHEIKGSRGSGGGLIKVNL